MNTVKAWIAHKCFSRRGKEIRIPNLHHYNWQVTRKAIDIAGYSLKNTTKFYCHLGSERKAQLYHGHDMRAIQEKAKKHTWEFSITCGHTMELKPFLSEIVIYAMTMRISLLTKSEIKKIVKQLWLSSRHEFHINVLAGEKKKWEDQTQNQN